MNIQLYKNTAPVNQLNKLLETLGTKEIVLKENCSEINPILILSLKEDLLGANYCYIPKFKRYYFINNIVIVDNRIEAHLSVDVLNTYKESIKISEFVFRRTEKQFNSYLSDGNQLISSKHYIANLKFDSTPFTTAKLRPDGITSVWHYVFLAINDGNTTPT